MQERPGLSSPPPHPGQVAIIGAGISGLACACMLQDHGITVTVYEKSRGPGGRSATRRLPSECSFDHGAQYFTARDPLFQTQVITWIEQGIVAAWDGRIVRLSDHVITDTSPLPRYVGVPGMSAIGRKLAEGLTVVPNKLIQRVEPSDGDWILTDGEGSRSPRYNVVVVTLPAPQTATLLADHPLSARAKDVTMTPCWAVMVEFASRYDVPWDGAFVHDSPLSWVARNSSKPGRNAAIECWVLHASPEWSTAHLEIPPDVVGSELLMALGNATGVPVPATSTVTAHRWRYSEGSDLSQPGTLSDASGTLLLAGDWLNGGRIEGAYLSGVRAAEQILQNQNLWPAVQESMR